TRFDCDWSSDVCSSDLHDGDRACLEACRFPSLALAQAAVLARVRLARPLQPLPLLLQSPPVLNQAKVRRAHAWLQFDAHAQCARSEERRVGKECRVLWW